MIASLKGRLSYILIILVMHMFLRNSSSTFEFFNLCAYSIYKIKIKTRLRQIYNLSQKLWCLQPTLTRPKLAYWVWDFSHAIDPMAV